MVTLRLQNPREIFKDTQSAGQALASEEFHHRALQGKVNACASQENAPFPLLWSLRMRRKEGCRGHREGAQTAGIPAATPSAGHPRASTSRDSRRTDTARSPGKRRLYIISRRAARAPERRGPLPAAPTRGGAGAARGARRRDTGTCGRPQRRCEPGTEYGGRAPRRGMPRAAAEGRRRCGARPGRAGRGPGSPRPPPAASAQRAPRRSARDRPAAHLSRALPEWLCGIAS